jgi:hypothetical protein
VLFTATCAKKPAQDAPVANARVTEVSLGRAVNTAQQVDQPTSVFAPADTIFASVKTENTPAGTRITARWVYTEGGAENVVSENDLLTTQAGTGWTSFYITNPGPWPAGSYEFRVGVNGEVKESKGFSVRG